LKGSSRNYYSGYINTSKGLVLQRYYAPSSIDGLQEEVGVVKKVRLKIKRLLGLQHIRIPIQLDLWGNEIYSGEKDKQHYMDTQNQRH